MGLTLPVSLTLQAVNEHGQVLGEYVEDNPGCPSAPFCIGIRHSFIATPERHGPPRTPRWLHHSAKWNGQHTRHPVRPLAEVEDDLAQRREGRRPRLGTPLVLEQGWMPALEDGVVVLINGKTGQVVGRK